MGRVSDLDITLREIADIASSIGLRYPQTRAMCRAILDRVANAGVELDRRLWDFDRTKPIFLAVAEGLWACGPTHLKARANCLAFGGHGYDKMLIYEMPVGSFDVYVTPTGEISWKGPDPEDRPVLLYKWIKGQPWNCLTERKNMHDEHD